MVSRSLSRIEARFLERARSDLRSGRLDSASNALGNVLALAPDCMEAVRMAGAVAQMRSEHARAAELFRRALEANPRDPVAQAGLGIALFEQGDLDAAIGALRRACELAPGLPSAWYNLGKALKLHVQTEPAIEALQRALSLDPAHVPARLTLADAQASIGKVDEAAANLRRVLRAHPEHPHAWFALANLKVVKLDSEDVARLRKATGNTAAPAESRVLLEFALARALEDQGDYMASFDVLQRANSTQRSRIAWDAARHRRYIEAIEQAFAAPLPSPLDAGQGKQVILIASVPRSGSTLVEQILASHPDVEGANEIKDLPLVLDAESKRRGSAFPQWVGAATAEDWRRLGDEYLVRTRRWYERKPRFTDKNLVSWERVGAALAMLPAARVVICLRDPLETCLACYRQWFSNRAEFSYDLDEMVDYLAGFHRLRRFWKKRYPLRVFNFSYESLQAGPEAAIRQLLDFLGLPFNSACMDFNKTERTVISAASAAQVRQPLRCDTARSVLYGDRLDSLRQRLCERGL